MPHSAHRLTTWLTWVLLTVAVSVATVSVVLTAVNGRHWWYALANVAMSAALAVCGALLATRRSRNPIGWLLLVGGLAHAVTAVALPLNYAPGLHAWVLSLALLLPLALLLFPTGRLPGPSWQMLVWALLVATPMVVIDWMPARVVESVLAAAVLASLVVRYLRGDEVLRRQLLWPVLALIGNALAFLPWLMRLGPIPLLITPVLVPAAITIALLRYRLLDIRLVVSRALLYLLLTVGVIALYSGVVLVIGRALNLETHLGVAALSAVAVAVLFNPVRTRLQRVLDRTLYGHRRDPVRALSHLSARLDAEMGSLDDLLTAVRDALQLPYVAFRLRGREVAASGSAAGVLEIIPLAASGTASGEMVIGVRPGQSRLGSQDVHVLSVLAIPLGVALRATMLSEELQQSRERIVAAREEERRRLRRDLHDGLGPTLSGVAYATDAVRNLARSDPDTAVDLLMRLRGDIGDAIVEIRRLVEGLRPPALDELGLVGALHREAERLSYQDGGRPLTVSVDAPPDMPELPAAIEVAAYRISAEALNNAAKHSGAENVRVRITVGDELHIQVRDNGTPGPDGWLPGVGLASMSERAAEVGGRCEARPGPDGGNVEAVLPLKPW
ncbi:signal transduction histidine kinase [Kibdelosporangium banguiense]|uniref:Signal transduction histidine kinase n=1 Tax=Kibdelosporangium banguiense TaxID=1365924 RepID=A0ABS4T742_9PSEU|nr:histidine kinase [Kibdelosporangium banguiense]MBP2320091.1 signal transduction histidine kinase [Kibdelosporangium banguiense]